MPAVYHYVGGGYQPRTMDEVLVALERGDYLKVATVDCETLDEAYAYTQNIDRPWIENPTIMNNGINNFDPDINSRDELPGLRSTMIGDIVVQRLQFFMVDRIGFTPIPEKSA